jgi:hypothetical protein
VTHGHTFTTREQFVEVAKAVAECAFVTSKLPVSLSLEMHCSPSQQKKIAEIMVEHIGSALLKVSRHAPCAVSQPEVPWVLRRLLHESTAVHLSRSMMSSSRLGKQARFRPPT